MPSSTAAPVPLTDTREVRVVRVRKAAGRKLTEGLIWVEAYLPFDAAAFKELGTSAKALGTAEQWDWAAAAVANPALARKALDPIDAQGECMLPDDLQLLAHRYLAESRKVDVQHDGVPRTSAAIVESFINGPEVASPNFFPGAWVVVIKVAPGTVEFAALEAGTLNAVSFQALVVKQPVTLRAAA